jgi:dihydrofolate reductase
LDWEIGKLNFEISQFKNFPILFRVRFLQFNAIITLHICVKTILMRKVILGLAVSLDGYLEGPKGEYDWCFTDQDYGMSAFFKRIDAIFMGRKTYEMAMGMSGGGGGMPKMEEYVFSNTLDSVKKGVTLIKGDIKAQVNTIKKEEGKDIWLFGGAGLTASFMNMGLVDELGLAVHPVLLGGGKPLFQDIGKRIRLSLTDSKTYSSGLVSLTYKVG